MHRDPAADRVVSLLNTLLLMAVAFLPFATSVLAGAMRAGEGEREARPATRSSRTPSTGRRFQLALVWLTVGALLGAAVPILVVIVIAAFNAYYWLTIWGESPSPRRGAAWPARKP